IYAEVYSAQNPGAVSGRPGLVSPQRRPRSGQAVLRRVALGPLYPPSSAVLSVPTVLRSSTKGKGVALNGPLKWPSRSPPLTRTSVVSGIIEQTLPKLRRLSQTWCDGSRGSPLTPKP